MEFYKILSLCPGVTYAVDDLVNHPIFRMQRRRLRCAKSLSCLQCKEYLLLYSYYQIWTTNLRLHLKQLRDSKYCNTYAMLTSKLCELQTYMVCLPIDLTKEEFHNELTSLLPFYGSILTKLRTAEVTINDVWYIVNDVLSQTASYLARK